jgi:orotate phosphoribosyltransferase
MNERDGTAELRSRLFALLKERAFRRGRIVLASGRESDFYFDMKPAMLDPDGAGLMTELILQQIHDIKADCVGGLEMGAVPLIAPVAMRSLDFGRRLPGFFVRKAVKDHGTKKRVDGADIAGKRVIILEDVTTTGGSAMDAVKAVEEAGAKVALVLAILDRGEYNCVSATLMYGIAARAFGLEMQVVETPRHIFLRLETEGREVDIESTSPTGFDFTGDFERFRRYTMAYRYAAGDEMERRGPYERFERSDGILEPVSLERATGFLWHNTAERALARGDAVKAAESFLAEYRTNPELATRLDGFSTSLARAFRIEYEDGGFDNAYRIVEMELKIFPNRTTTRDRLLAAASKRIESACDRDDPAGAERVLDDAEDVLGIPSDLSRLEREVCPLIAAAAVRLGDWPRAQRLASRYVGSEPDPVEGARFLAWVESRKAEGGYCPESLSGARSSGAGPRP